MKPCVWFRAKHLYRLHSNREFICVICCRALVAIVPIHTRIPETGADVLSLPKIIGDMTELFDVVEGIIHEPTQVRDDDGIDLTVGEIYEIHEPGRLDFGGGELAPAELTPHDRVWRNEDDEYQWWHLESGTVLIEYNESLSGPALLQPRTELVERGASHPTLRLDELPRIPLTVGDGGLRIKENARVSTLLPR